jgi:hypothetical protein
MELLGCSNQKENSYLEEITKDFVGSINVTFPFTRNTFATTAMLSFYVL